MVGDGAYTDNGEYGIVSRPKPIATEMRRPPTGDQVADFLRRNPDFLQRHPDLVEVLQPPTRSPDGNVVDMQHFMIERLQTRLNDLEQDHRDLVQTTRNNIQTQGQIHAAVLDILDARTFEHFVQAITSEVAMHMRLDVIALCIEREKGDRPTTRTGIRFLHPGEIDTYINPDEPAALRNDIRAERRVYGPGAALVRSDALLRLSISEESPRGMLALGSREPDNFPDDQNLDMLVFLGNVIESTARAWLDLPR